jgi:BirA family biotin operon repressor/biotin-[acetyl-CoA-carboxylase] ligase
MDARVSLALRERSPRRLPQAELGQSLKLPPARLRCALDELASLGFTVEMHPMLGLRLTGVPQEILEEEVACNLAVRRIGRRVRCVESTASTNDLAWEAAARGPEESDGLAIFAELQSAGRGRRGNRWLAPRHSSILCSVVVWLPQPPPSPTPRARCGSSGARSNVTRRSRVGLDLLPQGAWPPALTRGAALAAALAVEDRCGVSVGIKWPNDLVVEDRKIGGILVEARPVAGEAGPVVIGIGLNCTQGPEAFPPEIRGRVASLGMFAENADRTLLARSLLLRLDGVLGRMAEPGGRTAVSRDAAARCQTLGRQVSVRDGQAIYTGEVIDLDADYGLILRLPEGGIRRFPAMTT